MNGFEIYIIRDASNGDILEVSIDREDAEHQCTLYLGTQHGDREHPTFTQPVLESYRVQLDEPIDEPRTGESLKRRVETRQRREQAEHGELIQMTPGGPFYSKAAVHAALKGGAK